MWGGGNVFSEKMKAENMCKCLQGYRGPDTQTLSHPYPTHLVAGSQQKQDLYCRFLTSPCLHFPSLLSTLALVSSELLAPTHSVGPGPTRCTCRLPLIFPVSIQVLYKDFRSGSPAGSLHSCSLKTPHSFLRLTAQIPTSGRRRKPRPGDFLAGFLCAPLAGRVCNSGSQGHLILPASPCSVSNSTNSMATQGLLSYLTFPDLTVNNSLT